MYSMCVHWSRREHQLTDVGIIRLIIRSGWAKHCATTHTNALMNTHRSYKCCGERAGIHKQKLVFRWVYSFVYATTACISAGLFHSSWSISDHQSNISKVKRTLGYIVGSLRGAFIRNSHRRSLFFQPPLYSRHSNSANYIFSFSQT